MITCNKNLKANVSADGICEKMFVDIFQGLSDIYLTKAEKAATDEEKKYYYNKVLHYSGLKAVIEEQHISPLRLTMHPSIIHRCEDENQNVISGNPNKQEE